jgi:hypothetical protein
VGMSPTHMWVFCNSWMLRVTLVADQSSRVPMATVFPEWLHISLWLTKIPLRAFSCSDSCLKPKPDRKIVIHICLKTVLPVSLIYIFTCTVLIHHVPLTFKRPAFTEHP